MRGASPPRTVIAGAESVIGRVIRRALRALAQETVPKDVATYIERERPHWRAALFAAGVIGDEAELDAATIARHVANVLNDVRGRWLLSRRNAFSVDLRFALSDATERAYLDVDVEFIDDAGVTWLVVLDTRESPQGAAELDRWLTVAARLPARAAVYRTAEPSWREVVA